MNSSSTHIINKVFVEVNTSSKDKAYYLKDNLSNFIKFTLLPELQQYFDELTEGEAGRIIQIDNLTIDIPLGNKEDLKELKPLILNKVVAKVDELKESALSGVQDNSIKINKLQDRILDKWIYFLQNGTTAWWDISNKDAILFEKDVIDHLSVGEGLDKLSSVLQEEQAVIRLIKQFDDAFISSVFEILHHKNIIECASKEDKLILVKKLTKAIASFKNPNRTNFWRLPFKIFFPTSSPKAFSSLLLDFIYELPKITGSNPSKELLEQFIVAKLQQQTELELLFSLESVVNDFENLARTNNPLSQSFPNDTNEENLKDTDQTEVNQKMNINKSDQLKSKSSQDDQSSKPTEDKNTVINRDLKVNSAPQNKVVDTFRTSSEDFKFSLIDQEHYIDNAGLILTHPFLAQLLLNCNLINDQNEIIDKEKAVHLLHYVATGKQQQPENLMVFEKFLCNLPINQPINRFVVLEDKVKYQVEDMLKSLLSHWSVLKNSSIELLQNEFLQRPGKLKVDQDRPQIIIERKTQDILLDKISWNISIIKLKWKDKLLFVDW
ncbi:contractile injection system tape measure protein [Aquimarina brevivitae]|uniref:Uncharacterized protein n=1 Tax=Aquimarina brevivitae TaxID=323412 RepID=A0A4Q7NYU3_9FLAO|nr:contractile injection system tape measure protein [Aquimarina brevivitae]RZS92505.1 hypothetical protein EV197_2643 [Aquimarina brevivitae]